MQPPVYNPLFNFADGAQEDIFEDSMLPVYDYTWDPVKKEGRGTGEVLFDAMRGVDGRRVEGGKARKSVSCDINVSFWIVWV